MNWHKIQQIEQTPATPLALRVLQTPIRIYIPFSKIEILHDIYLNI